MQTNHSRFIPGVVEALIFYQNDFAWRNTADVRVNFLVTSTSTEEKER
jgi:hypothetical protein